MKIAKIFVAIIFCSVATATDPMQIKLDLADDIAAYKPTVVIEDLPDNYITRTRPVVRVYDLPSTISVNRRITSKNFNLILNEVNPIQNNKLPIITNRRNFSDEEKTCLAKNIYFEARNESIRGQVAVALVTLNRVHESKYPNDICNVVYDHMQFSWYWDGLPDRPKQRAAYDRAKLIASVILTPELEIIDFTKGATHYHANYVEPCWSKHLQLTVTIQTHIFYKEDPNGGRCAPRRTIESFAFVD